MILMTPNAPVSVQQRQPVGGPVFEASGGQAASAPCPCPLTCALLSFLPCTAGRRALAAHNAARQRRKQQVQRSGAATGSGTGSEGSVSPPQQAGMPAAAALGATAGPAVPPQQVGAPAVASLGAAAGPLPPTQHCSGSLGASQQASVAGLAHVPSSVSRLRELEELVAVPSLPAAPMLAPGRLQPLLVPSPFEEPLASALLAGSLDGSCGTGHASGAHPHPGAQQHMLPQVQAGPLLPPPQQAQQALPPLALLPHQQQQQQQQQQGLQAQPVPWQACNPAAAVSAAMPVVQPPLPPYISPATLHRVSLKVRCLQTIRNLVCVGISPDGALADAAAPPCCVPSFLTFPPPPPPPMHRCLGALLTSWGLTSALKSRACSSARQRQSRVQSGGQQGTRAWLLQLASWQRG